MTRRKIINCFDRLELLVGNRTPAHGSEAPFLVKLLEAIAAEKKIVEELLEREAVFADDPVPPILDPDLVAAVKRLEATAVGGHRDPPDRD